MNAGSAVNCFTCGHRPAARGMAAAVPAYAPAAPDWTPPARIRSASLPLRLATWLLDCALVIISDLGFPVVARRQLLAFDAFRSVPGRPYLDAYPPRDGDLLRQDGEWSRSGRVVAVVCAVRCRRNHACRDGARRYRTIPFETAKFRRGQSVRQYYLRPCPVRLAACSFRKEFSSRRHTLTQADRRTERATFGTSPAI
jgi:hypothetical protein